MLKKLKARLSRNAMLGQVETMPDRALADLGVSRAQLSNLVRIPDEVPARMGQMAERFGADMDELQRARDSYLDAVEACNNCSETKACGRELARKGSNKAKPEELSFCPNADLYSKMTKAAA